MLVCYNMLGNPNLAVYVQSAKPRPGKSSVFKRGKKKVIVAEAAAVLGFGSFSKLWAPCFLVWIIVQHLTSRGTIMGP